MAAGGPIGAWADDFATVLRQTSETHNDMMLSVIKEVQDGSFVKKLLPERL